MRKLFWLWMATALVLPAGAADLTRGITFTDGQRVTAANLHNLVDLTSIGTAFYANQDAQTTLAATDVVLVYSPTLTDYRKMTASSFLYGNTAIITGLSAKAVPTSSDYVFAYDAAGLTLVKISLGALVLNNTNLIAGASSLTNALQTAELLLLNDGTNNRITVSNLFWSGMTWNKPFTNLLTHTAPTNQDRLLIWDSAAGTNKTTTLAGLITNLPTATNFFSTNLFMTISEGVVSQVPWSALSNTIITTVTNSYAAARFTSYQTPLTSGVIINTNHGLGTAPAKSWGQLVCVTADDGGYVVGDRIDIGEVEGDDESFPSRALQTWINSTNAGLVWRGTGYLTTPSKTNSARVALTDTRWEAVIYAER